jgi:hypothetical protein
LTGIAKCNIANNGNSIANQLSTINLEHIDDAITTIKAMPRTSGQSSIPQHINNNVSQLLHCVRTSCVPIGYTNEAAADARSKMFSLWMTFGVPSLLFTFSPCDECSFLMQLYATEKKTELPNIHEPVETLFEKLGIRKLLRVQNPGACARMFDSLHQIVIKELIGWSDVAFLDPLVASLNGRKEG